MELCLTPALRPVSNCILTPAQQLAADTVLSAVACGNVIVLEGDIGRGKTTVLRYVQARTSGALLGAREFMQELEACGPFAIEEAWVRLIETTLAMHDLVLVDDLHLLVAVGSGYSYPRSNLLNVAIIAVL